MAQEIKYIGFYDLPDSTDKRVSNLAASNKMDYICESIIKAGFTVHQISPSWINDSKCLSPFYPQKVLKVGSHRKITFCPSFRTRGKFTRNVKIIFSLAWLFYWLLFNVRRNEKVLLYHVPWLSVPIRWAKTIKGFKLILEVEEIYGDVSVILPYFNKLESKLLKSADSYLFSTDLLAVKIGKLKPYVVIYGAYTIYPTLATPPKDGKTHLLYAGIIDSHKAGAFNALEAAKFLSNSYVLHIIGFGEIKLLEEKIEEVNELAGCQVVYDGILSGDEYIKYCQKCHIGLSTQNVDGKYLESSFPSKILNYLGLGLCVVSGDIECVRQSKISSAVSYYQGRNAKEIAAAIEKCKYDVSVDNNKLIRMLSDEFIENMRSMLKGK